VWKNLWTFQGVAGKMFYSSILAATSVLIIWLLVPSVFYSPQRLPPPPPPSPSTSEPPPPLPRPHVSLALVAYCFLAIWVTGTVLGLLAG
jgi:hypothetical protein